MILPNFYHRRSNLLAIVHEYMHGWTANELGDPTAKKCRPLTLNPLSHLDLWGSVLLPILLYYDRFIFGSAKAGSL